MVRELTETDADALIARYIIPHPWRAGRANYVLEESGISVWAIIASLRLGDGNFDGTAAMYGIPREQVEAVWAYYLRHREVVDDRLEQQGIWFE